ncbi:hypothetical protein H112_00543 [Trichophyton rubrum D6]|uniref:Uncharacterized protein n=3 Tax=Trichophyton TaxID=5550 RepID=F2T017_TRIRC|nr:uncharacterized protein TERG_08155 [Trichophyton rubrum CBS 118892]EZF27442.1 hypothetical protein H100_00542 [Trichophyton rubrum MR850]EZF46472.1 hypothetical protein H102_00542 [Trichophyton rubrum CBS 100081]EZF57130.1 hypothetical protein H103_00542 [Trichophyton rubrum CBS 288.86]EZF67699.1 hypothetical protein H104_00532 [Trichophyton rubrum CBS 289.86]EZF78373.1 hypothetical protein H105_00530 [Trichophyton soudanense CBS 452.61]EZF89069.1 hypothetical protein H110_00546 [Trichophy
MIITLIFKRVQTRTFTAEDLFPLWKDGKGLCTSFATYVASRLENSVHPTLFQLNETHRACFIRDGVVIDSSARNILESKDEKPVSGHKGPWKFDKSSNDVTLIFQASKSSKFIAFSPYRAILKQCITVYCSSAVRNPLFASSELNQMPSFDSTGRLHGSHTNVVSHGASCY